MFEAPIAVGVATRFRDSNLVYLPQCGLETRPYGQPSSLRNPERHVGTAPLPIVARQPGSHGPHGCWGPGAGQVVVEIAGVDAHDHGG